MADNVPCDRDDHGAGMSEFRFQVGAGTGVSIYVCAGTNQNFKGSLKISVMMLAKSLKICVKP